LEGLDDPYRAILACARILAAAGDPRLAPFLNSAYQTLQAEAARFTEIEQQRLFLESSPVHREIARIWGELKKDFTPGPSPEPGGPSRL
jgi:hypothetical protein